MVAIIGYFVLLGIFAGVKVGLTQVWNEGWYASENEEE